MPVRNQVLSALGHPFSSKLQELDLEPIKNQLMQSGWTRQQTTWAINRYKMFLSVIYLNPHTPLVPTQEIDFVWHCHILHTRKYYQDCQMLFGRFIHHEPDSLQGRQADQLSLDAAFAQTTALFEYYFPQVVLRDGQLVQFYGKELAENDKEKTDLRFYRSACGRPVE